jgi:tetratricopeptide (TPR) repeat protein
LARSPDIPFADTDWGAMLLAAGDAAGAIGKFQSANQKGPKFADPLEGWGEALMAKNQSHLALAKFAEAEKYAPNWGRQSRVGTGERAWLTKTRSSPDAHGGLSRSWGCSIW